MRDQGGLDEVVDLDDVVDQQDEAGGHWGPAYEEMEMTSEGGDQGYSYVDIDGDAGAGTGLISADGYQTVTGGGRGTDAPAGAGNDWAYFPSSRTGYRRLVQPYSSTSTPSSSTSSPTSRVKLNLLLCFFALALASLGMISLMLPSLGGVEFGVRVVAHGHGHGHRQPTIIGVEEGLDGLRLGKGQGQGQQIGHEVDGLKRKKRSQVSAPTEDHDEEDNTPTIPVMVDERKVTAHQASMKQSRERLERRLQKVGRGGLGGHVKRQKRRSWGIWAA